MGLRKDQPLNETQRKVLLFLADTMEERKSDTLESAGIAELASLKGAVNLARSFSVNLSTLKFYGLVETTRIGREALYTLTENGLKEVQSLRRLDELEAQSHNENQIKETVSMGKSLEDQIGKLVEAGKLPNPTGAANSTTGGTPAYTAPIGVALPKKGTYPDTVEGLRMLYRDRMNSKPEQNEIERIEEWFIKLTELGKPAFEWMQEAIIRTSGKVKTEQRHIGYVLGILKTWSNYGYGIDLSSEQKKIVEKFAGKFNHSLSTIARNNLLALIDKYGIVDTLTALLTTEFEPVDISVWIVDQIEKQIEKDGA